MGDVVDISAHPRFRQHAMPEVSKGAMALLLGRSRRWIEQMHHEGLPSRVDGNGQRRYVPTEVLSWVEANTRRESNG